MTRGQSFLAYVALILGAIGFASTWARSTPAQGPVPSSSVGRYQACATGAGNIQQVFVTDTVTGRTWHHFSSGGSWTDFGAPPTAR